MIRPVNFKFNEQTAGNNKFQQASEQSELQQQALNEFDGFVKILRKNGVEVTVIDDTLNPATPDSIFPNNWISFHDDGSVFLYPMFSENRRLERRDDIIQILEKKFSVRTIIDLSFFEFEKIYLEGTGSLVLDRINKLAYACLSVRTNKTIIDDFCANSGYNSIIFNAIDSTNFPIYHTNVMMCVGDEFAVICLESISNLEERENVNKSLIESGKEVVAINFDQMNHFAGNMLQVKNDQNKDLLVMSEQAFKALNESQISTLEKYAKIIHAPLYKIEQNGGGSARCMLAEVHLPLIN